MTETDRSPSPAVGRTLAILETMVNSAEELTLTALAKQAGIPLATCASIVYTLEQRGYATRWIVGRSHFWQPTLKLYGLATQLVRKLDLSSVALEGRRALANKFGMPVHIGVLTGASVVYVAKTAMPAFVQFDTYPGKVSPYNLTALGRAIAAQLPESELRPLLTQRSAGSGPRERMQTDEEFRAELARIRKQGYAVEDQEERADIACVAAAFSDSTGQVAGAVGVTGFAKDLSGQKRRTAQIELVELARVISRELGAPT